MVVISRISAAAIAMRLSHPHALVALVCFFLAGACVPVFVFVLAVVLMESFLLTSFMLCVLSVVVLCSKEVSVTRTFALIDAPGFVFKVCVSFPPDHVAVLVKYGVSMMDVVSMVSFSICIWGSSICTVVSFCITSVRLDCRTEVVSCRRTVSVLYTFVLISLVAVCLVMDFLVVPHPAMIIMAMQVMIIASMVIFHFICFPRFLLVKGIESDTFSVCCSMVMVGTGQFFRSYRLVCPIRFFQVWPAILSCILRSWIHSCLSTGYKCIASA